MSSHLHLPIEHLLILFFDLDKFDLILAADNPVYPAPTISHSQSKFDESFLISFLKLKSLIQLQLLSLITSIIKDYDNQTVFESLKAYLFRPRLYYKSVINLRMQTLILLALVIVIGWILFRPITKKELDRYNDKDNWPDIDLH